MRPSILNVYHYETFEGYYLWESVLDASITSKSHMPLNEYTSYDADYSDPSVYFDPWTKMLELVPQQYIMRCSEMGPGSVYDRMASAYTNATNNTDLDCILNDTVWLSSACRRRNGSRCFPLLTQYDYAQGIQLAYFLNWAVAIVRVRYGTPIYYQAVRRGRFLFGWYQPDDSLVDAAGKLPVMLQLPPTDELEQVLRSPPIFRPCNSNSMLIACDPHLITTPMHLIACASYN